MDNDSRRGKKILTEETDHQKVELTADIVAAYVANNPVAVASMPELIESVSRSLDALQSPTSPPEEPLQPAVNPKRSVRPDYIVCLEDGKKFKSLKRHLDVHYNLTPEEYRAKWRLPPDYPMTAPNYSAERSALAKKVGLGRKPGKGSTKRRRAG